MKCTKGCLQGQHETASGTSAIYLAVGEQCFEAPMNPEGDPQHRRATPSPFPGGGLRGETDPFNSPRRWAGRLAFPLLAAALLLAWRGAHVGAEEGAVLPRWAWWSFAGLAAVVGVVLVRARHRHP